MTTKKFFLTATLVATVFAFTVPVSFAACPTGGACPVESVQKVTPDTATCSKCKQEKDKCKCKKAKKKKCDPCETGAAAPCDPCQKAMDDCKCKKDK